MASTIYNGCLRHFGCSFWHTKQLKNIPGKYYAEAGAVIIVRENSEKTYSDPPVQSQGKIEPKMHGFEVFRYTASSAAK